jgi:ComF family protein
VLPYASFSSASFPGCAESEWVERCRLCQLVPQKFERAVAYGSYEGALRDLIHLLKFDHVRPAAKVLGRLLAEAIAGLEPSLPSGKIAVLPVPLHHHKKSERGFNQAEMIVHSALKQLRALYGEGRFELFTRSLVRVRNTGSQIGLSRDQRRRNLRGAFALKGRTSLAGRDVLLVDDVFTTGATASECSRVLLRAGAARVWVATIGRTLSRSAMPALPEDCAEEWAHEDRDPMSAAEPPKDGAGVGVQA